MIAKILRAVGATPVTTAGTVTGDWQPLDGTATHLTALLEVTAAATEAGDTLDVYIDGRSENGNAYNLVHFTQVLGNGGAKKIAAPMGVETTATIVDVSADATAGTTRALPLPSMIRLRYVTVDAATTSNMSFTFGVSVFGQ